MCLDPEFSQSLEQKLGIIRPLTTAYGSYPYNPFFPQIYTFTIIEFNTLFIVFHRPSLKDGND